MVNASHSVHEFVLHCAILPDQKDFVVALLVIIYMASFIGNLLVIFVIQANQQLQTAMYISISVLAVIDLANSTTFIPKLVTDLQKYDAVISYGACLLQMYVTLNLQQLEALLLCFMGLDRYVAVMFPLRYPTLITKKHVQIFVVCLVMFTLCTQLSFVISATELDFCHSNVLPFCFCDYATLVQIACNENPKYIFLLTTMVTAFGICPLQVILFSYARIAMVALKISSNDRNRKVFSTCVTHLMVVGLFYILPLASYLLPGAGLQISSEGYNILFIVGNVVPSMMNPVIYTLRNKEIKSSIYQFINGKKSNTERTDL